MRKEIVIIDKELGIYRVTTPDSRWYLEETTDEKTGLPVFSWNPSVTWISGFYPKGLQFYKYLASKGWDESQAIMEAAGSRGTKVHNAVTILQAGGTVTMEDKFTNPNTDLAEELTVEEYEAIVSFKRWCDEVNPEFILNEKTVISKLHGYAGTVDIVVKIGDQVYIIDVKTGQYIWPEYEIQIAAYKQALTEMGHKTENVKLAFLQLGYKKNKRGFKFTEVEDKFELFLHAKAIWENECGGEKPKQAEYPLQIKLKNEPESVPESKTTSEANHTPKPTSEVQKSAKKVVQKLTKSK